MSVKVTPGEVAYRDTELTGGECRMSPGEAYRVFLSLLNDAIEREGIEGKCDRGRSPRVLHELRDIRNELLAIFWSGCGLVPSPGHPHEPGEEPAQFLTTAN